MNVPRAEDVKRGISVIWENLQCPICLDLMSMPVSTKCDHQFCKFCMMKLLDRSRRKEASCPVCKLKVTKRSLRESPGFQKLVEGLQRLIQSYEYDTCTSYFTGMPQTQADHEREVEEHQSSGVNDSLGDSLGEGQDDNAVSLASSIAAKDGFAQLMALESSVSMASHNGGIDTVLDELPPVSEKEGKSCKSTCDTEGEQTEKPQRGALSARRQTRSCHEQTKCDAQEAESDKTQAQFVRTFDLCPARKLDHKLEKSVDKVSEWLLKMSPSENLQTSDNNGMSDDCDFREGGNYCSDDAVDENLVSKATEFNPRKEEKRKCLEAQIFGAVYKRDRKTSETKRKRILSHERIVETSPPHLALAEVEQMQSTTQRSRISGKLTPTDVIKICHPIDKEPAEKDESNFLEHDSAPNDLVKKTKTNNLVNVTDDRDGEEMVKSSGELEHVSEDISEPKEESGECVLPSPLSKVSAKKPRRASKAKMLDSLQDFDNEAKQKETNMTSENSDGKCFTKQTRRRSRRVSEATEKNSKLGENNHMKATRPLDLVCAEVNSCSEAQKHDGQPKLVDTEVQIDSYTSSEEPQVPVTRTTRRNKKLHEFAEEVQGRKNKTRTAKKVKQAAGELDCRPSECSSHAFGDDNANGPQLNGNVNKDSSSSLLSASGKTQTLPKKNGCICESDLGKIENIQSRDDEEVCQGEVNLLKESSAVMQNTGGLMECDVPCSLNMTVKSQNHPDPVVQSSSLPGIQPEPSSSAVALVHNDAAFIPETKPKCIKTEEENNNNDSELDTEQLMKSFKATKRKSFYLGSPKNSLSEKIAESPKESSEECAESQKDDPKKHTKAEVLELSNSVEGRCVIPSTAHHHCAGNSELSSSCASELIPPSNFPEPTPSVALDQRNTLKRTTRKKKSQCASTWNSSISDKSDPGLNMAPECPDQNGELPVYSEPVDSCQLFPALSAYEEDVVAPEKQFKSASRRPEAARTLKNNHDRCVMPSATDADVGETVHLIGNVPDSGSHSNLLESSITPDGLLPLVKMVPSATETVASLEGKEAEEKDLEIYSQPCVSRKRKRRAQKLESSESELSSDESDLPSIAQIFRRVPIDPQPLKEQDQHVISLSKDSQLVKEKKPVHGSGSRTQRDSLRVPERELGSGENERSARKQGCTGEQVSDPAAIEDIQDDLRPRSPHQDEWVTSSQGSVDLFDSPPEREETDEGVVNETGLSMDSSQYSSEVINTQQKVEMQAELRRLEKMMALVSEALQEKDPDPGTKTQTEALKGPEQPPSKEGSGTDNRASQHEAGRGGKRRTRQSASVSVRSRSTGPGAADSLGPTQPCASSSQCLAETAERHLSRRGQRLQNSRKQSPQRSTAQKQVKRQNVVPAASLASAAGQEAKGTRRATSQATARTGHAHRDATRPRMELVASGLDTTELGMVKKFSKKMGGSFSGQVTHRTTHIVIKTDENLVCERTLKYFQGIAGRKWIVSFLWISECFRQGKVLEESPFEVRGDAVNGQSHCGPQKARTTRDENLLMKGYEICFQGSFTDMTTDHMELMAEMCGATVVKDPLLFSSKKLGSRLVVVQPGSDDSQSYYRALQKKATVVARGWLLDSIATYTLQNPRKYGI